MTRPVRHYQETTIKLCRRCRESKPVGDFNAPPKNTYHKKLSTCKACILKRVNEWTRRNLERSRRNKRNYVLRLRALKGPKAPMLGRKVSYVKCIFKLDTNTARYWVERLKGACEICKQREPIRMSNGKRRSLAIDHDHRTGRIRGVVCSYCNGALGFAKDKISRLQALIKYLKRNR